MEYLEQVLSQSSFPVLSAFILGLMTAFSPCPLATNITATAYISKNIKNRRGIFLSGLVYTLGRVVAYSVLGVFLFWGASKFEVHSFFTAHGERVLAPLLLIIGLFMLDLIPIRFPSFLKISERLDGKKAYGKHWGSFLLGMAFALAFCPYSGVLYFGMLIPLSISSPDGLFLPVVYAVATALPVVVISYMLAFTFSKIGGFYAKVKNFEIWLRRVMAVVFIISGFYFLYLFLFA